MTASLAGQLILDPLVPWLVFYLLAGLAAVGLALAIWRRLSGWWLRGLAGIALLAAIANPSLQTEDRQPLADIIVAVVDESASQRVSDRADQSAAALAGLRAEVAARPNTELRVVTIGDDTGDGGSLVMTGLAQALAEEPQGRIAGIVLITDGRIHDIERAPALPAPLHTLLTGHASDWDRRLIVRNAPAFAILDEEVQLTLRIEDQGAAPEIGGIADLTISIDGGAPMQFQVPLGEDMELPIVLPHGGMNVLQFQTPVIDGELTARNNAAVVQINGVRDRLRVLLISGEPHAGERTWRNLLKSDSSVDLVHFTILRPPEKQDGIPVEELALIAFPTRELFVEKIKDFDLIIFDRYSMQGILPMSYIDNVVQYVKDGGTVLVAAGPEFGTIDSLWRTPLAEILPVEPTARIISEGYKPALTDLGRRHPVTEGLEALAPKGGWGRWFRLVEMKATAGQVVMSGPGDRLLLVLNRVGAGRVAVLASDHMWLWGRGFEGGGPQLELLRRLAHWMLKEPELEEEMLSAAISGADVTVTRRTVKDNAPGDLVVTGPDGTTQTLTMWQVTPGRYELRFAASDMGLYRLVQGDLSRVIAVGPTAPREFVETIATDAVMAPALAATGGGVLRIEDGAPDIRTVQPGRTAAGRGWIGITPRGAYETEDIRVTPLLPGWLALLAAAGLLVAAWLVEGRRFRRA